jgi:hypothetical protein
MRPQGFKESYINRALSTYGEPTYVEIGVRRGESFRLARATRKIGIDPVAMPEMSHLRHGEEYHEMTSDDFFAQRAPQVLQQASVHVALIDGLHEFRQVANDLLNLEPYMRDDGIVFLDDLNPRTREKASDVPTGEAWNGDAWKIAAFVARARPHLQLRTVDADQGVGMLAGFAAVTVPDLDVEIAECKALDYRTLERSRASLLNLIAPGDFGAALEEIRTEAASSATRAH